MGNLRRKIPLARIRHFISQSGCARSDASLALFRSRVLRSIFSKRSRDTLDVFRALTHGIIRHSIPLRSLATMLAHRLLLRLVRPSCMPESAYDDANPAGMSGSNVRTWSYRIKKKQTPVSSWKRAGRSRSVFSRSAPKINEN